jgi:hypothetical protein
MSDERDVKRTAETKPVEAEEPALAPSSTPEPIDDRDTRVRAGYGDGQWGLEQQDGWRGPGEGPTSEPFAGSAAPFQQGSAGGQVPGEYRQWPSGKRPDGTAADAPEEWAAETLHDKDEDAPKE